MPRLTSIEGGRFGARQATHATEDAAGADGRTACCQVHEALERAGSVSEAAAVMTKAGIITVS